ncbi:hypothetical protein [Paenibacillus sp. Root444D2]|uniref:hypothetical protein n=1 Tax=Paenibacillus sp. Root444D2 TaxID=1736538 RepID=UPI00070C69C6|nr:hypothetical protein [Paenibacillus sp. Root444D2]KQX57315.1 hypothetical protein ASD40_32695 [Paenibacillus sp. Root444D2]
MVVGGDRWGRRQVGVAGGIAEGRQERKTNEIAGRVLEWRRQVGVTEWNLQAGVTQVVFYTTIIWINRVSAANVAENTTILLKRAHFG